MTSLPNPWESLPSHTGLINISPDHSLEATLSGPLRENNSPLTITIPGLAASASEWVAVHRLASKYTRTLLYNRSGYGLSTPPPSSRSPTAVSIAEELLALLKVASLPGPYILIAHSWGGIIAREFLELKSSEGKLGDVAGMVFVDANQELNTTLDLWPEDFVQAIWKGLDVFEVTGVRSHTALSPAEWAAFEEEEASEKHQATAALEFNSYRPSGPILAEKKQLESSQPVLGTRPVSVLKGNSLRDFTEMYEAGLAAGNGMRGQRNKYKNWIEPESHVQRDEGWQRGNMRLSWNARFVRCKGEWTGHNVQLTEPETIVGELRWVLEGGFPDVRPPPFSTP